MKRLLLAALLSASGCLAIDDFGNLQQKKAGGGGIGGSPIASGGAPSVVASSSAQSAQTSSSGGGSETTVTASSTDASSTDATSTDATTAATTTEASSSTGAPAPYCGDGNCDAGEDCANCQADCSGATQCYARCCTLDLIGPLACRPQDQVACESWGTSVCAGAPSAITFGGSYVYPPTGGSCEVWCNNFTEWHGNLGSAQGFSPPACTTTPAKAYCSNHGGLKQDGAGHDMVRTGACN